MKVAEVPNPRVERGSYVQDSAHLLSEADKSSLDALAVDLEAKTGAELAVVTVNNLGGITVEEFADRLFKRYGVGKKAKENGLLILVARDDRRFRVETGYGLEAILPDAICKRLMDQLAVPRFKTGQFALGIHSLAYALAERIAQSEGRSLQVSPPESTGREAIPLNEPPADSGTGQAQASGGLAEAITPSFPWWKGLNGAVPVVITFFVLLYRGTRILLSKAYASRKLFYGDDATGFPVAVWVLTFFGTIFFVNIANAFVLPAGSFLLGGGLCTGLWVAWRRFFRSLVLEYSRTCPQCGLQMRRMDEKADDALLTQAQRDEERAQGMDYEFWDCPGCSYHEHFEVKLPFASKCPKCGNRTLHSKTTVLSAATTSSSGSKRIDEDCYYAQCKYHTSKTVTIPRISSSSSSSGGGGSSGGSFGGGSSGGGGASGGW